jgi:hypothetical protein
MMKLAAMSGVGAMIVQVILSNQISISAQKKAFVVKRRTEFEMASPRTGKNLTTDALTIPVFPGGHINR